MADSHEPDLSTVESPPLRPDLEYDMVHGGEIIGRGGHAIVSRTQLTDEDPPDVIAVKEPKTSRKGSTGTRVTSFLQEADTWLKLSKLGRENQYDNHVVGVVATGDELPWIAMEYMDGGSLADRLNANAEGLPIDEAVWITERLCKGLKVAHDPGIAHLDLKPSNILFRETPENKWPVPKIADWGLARSRLDESEGQEVLSPR